jgi:hypothetical protein
MDGNKSINLKKALLSGEDIMLNGITINEELNLTEIVRMNRFSEKSSYGRVKSNIFFMECTFTKPFIAFTKNSSGGEDAIQFEGNISFINCKFEDEFSLRSCIITGAADFSNTTFKKNANFQDVIFMQRANFNKAFWSDEAQFQNARFYHKTNFMDIKADNHLMFQSAVFHDETNFSLAECLKYVDFSLVRFDGPALFNYIKWKDRAVFNNATWMMDCTFIEPEFGDVSFKNSDVRGKYLMNGEKISGNHIKSDSE